MASSGLLVTQFDYSKLFIWNPRFRTATYTNTTGSTVSLLKGTVMGRIMTSNKVTPALSTATDGSQIPMGVLQQEYDNIANNASVIVSYCVAGDVAREGLIFYNGTDTLATVITLTDSATNTVKIGTIEDILIRSGIITVATTDNTLADNA